jgi:hypothetical protein
MCTGSQRSEQKTDLSNRPGRQPIARDFISVLKFARCIGAKIETNVRFEPVHVDQDRVEWVGAYTVEVEESSQSVCGSE